jgi:hypothetical protein
MSRLSAKISTKAFLPLGATGATGIAGATGSAGANGASGATGVFGATGISGATGINGASGATGINGASGVGATGAQGIGGATGPEGVQGIQGIQGASGVQGASGIQGASGASGIAGASGSTGPTGNNGINGATGSGGATGSAGASGVAPAVINLQSTFTLDSGKTLSAGKVVSLTSTGTVGSYPQVATFSSEFANSSANLTSGYSVVSTDGSRTLKFVNTSTTQWTVYGTAISEDGTTTNGTSSTATTAASDMGTSTSSDIYAWALTSSTFLVMTYIGTWGNNQFHPHNNNIKLIVATVDSSGNISWGTSTDFGNYQQYGYPSQTKVRYWARVETNRFLFYVFTYYTSTPNDQAYWMKTYKHVTISGTTISTSDDTEVADFTSNNSPYFDALTLTSGNKVVSPGVGANYTGYRVASYTSNNIASGYSDTTIITDNYGTVVWYKMDTTKYLAYYQDTNLNYKYKTFSVNQSTGALTLIDTKIVTQANQKLAGFVFKDATSALGYYSSGGNYYVNTMSFDSSGNILGFNVGNVVGLTYTHSAYSSTDKFKVFYYNTSSYNSMKLLTVTAYSTDPFNFLGISESSQSVSPATVITDGIAGGFSGLSIGSIYYLSGSLDGSVTTSSTTGVLIGKAISTTQILLNRTS